MPTTSSTDSHPVEQQQPNSATHDGAQPSHECHENTPAYFRREALKKIEELRVPIDRIAELQSSLDLIMKKYDFDTSYIDQMAEWFKKEAWWFEVRGFCVLTAGAIALTYAPIALAITSVIASITINLYYLAKFLLVDHYDRTSRREQRISDQITQLEANVLHSVNLLTEAEKQINLMLISLCEINARSAEKLQTFEEQTSILSTQMIGFLDTIHQLEELKNSLTRDNEIISIQLADAMSKIESSKMDIEQGALTFDSVTKDLAETNKTLLKGNDELMALHKKIQNKLASLEHVEAPSQEQLTILKHGLALGGTTKRLYTTDMTFNSQNHLEDRLENTDNDDPLILAELAMKEFHTHMAELAIYKQTPTYNSVSMRFFTSAPSFEAKEYQRPSPSEF